MTNIGGWPPRLKDVPYQFEALTTRPIRTERMEVAVGTKVSVTRGHEWRGFVIKTASCSDCGVSVFVRNVGKDALQPLF